MNATPTVDPPDRASSTPHLTPVVRVRTKDPGVDAAERIAACMRPFLPPGWNDGAGSERADGHGLFAVADPESILGALAPGARRAAGLAATQFQTAITPRLIPALGSAVTLQVTLLPREQDGIPAGAVVLQRDSTAATEQYAFPFVVVDADTAQWEVLPLPTRPPAHRGVRPMAGGLQFGQQLVGAAMAVTPFLPPPYGAAVTGTLSLLNLILGVAGDQPGSGPTPLEAAVESIEGFITETTLSEYAGAIRGPANEYANMAKTQTEDIASLSSIGGGTAAMLKKLDETWTPAVVTANASLYQLLKLRDTTNFSATLSLLISGVTTELLMYHGQVAIGAVDASIRYRHRDLDGYAATTSAWTTIAKTAANDIGEAHTGDWTDDEIEDAMNSSAYIPLIEAWMEKAKRDRLAKVTDVERCSFGFYGGGTTVPAGYTEWGWTFQDKGSAGDGGYEANHVADTPASRPCDDAIQHKDTVVAHRAAYITDLARTIDDGFAPHRTIMASWTTYVADLLALLPPGIPATPTVTSAPAGQATPVGSWKDGSEVRYALMARSAKGPAPAGDWSAPLRIGTTAGADITGIGGVSGADAIVVLRQFRDHPADGWGDAEQVAALTPPFPSSHRDTELGGDPW